VAFPGCYLPLNQNSTCNTTVTFTIDTSQLLGRNGQPADGVSSLRVSALSPQLSGCAVIFNSTFNNGSKTVIVTDSACSAHTAGFVAPLVLNNRGTWSGVYPALPPVVQGLGSSGLPWNSGNPTTMTLQGWLPGYSAAGGVPKNVTDASGLTLPAYGATCVGSVNVTNRIVMTDASFLPPPMTYSSIIEYTTAISNDNSSNPVADVVSSSDIVNPTSGAILNAAGWFPNSKANSSWVSHSLSQLGLVPGRHKVTFRVDSSVRSEDEVFLVSSGGMGSVLFNLTGVPPGTNTAAVLIEFSYSKT